MPALVAFGRRWSVADDDFVFPGFIDVLIRVSWLIAGSIIYWKEETKLSCPGGDFMKYYLWGNTIILLLILVADIGLVSNSMNGVMMDTFARRYVRPFLYLRLILEIPELCWNVLGTIWVYSGNIFCAAEAPETLFLIKSLVILNWVMILVLLIFVAIVFDSSGARKSPDMEMDYDRFAETVLQGDSKSHRVWERRCRFLLCSCGPCSGDEVHRSAFKDVGKIMAYVFDDEIDVVPTDIAAGLIVINLKAQAEANELKNAPRSQGTSPILEESQIYTLCPPPAEWNSPTKVYHFMKYALGSYGWPWFLVANPKSGLFRLWENILCCGCCVSHPCSVEGDNCCYCHTSALKQTTSVQDSDLWYASFHNQVFQTPFFVAIDHSQRSVVIAIRGTMSLRDAITDLTAEAKQIESTGLPEGCKAHTGMMMTAQNILQKLNSLRVLERAKREYPDYNLVLTGHSLGAGAATILSFLLYPEFPTLKCYAYSPPGGLLSFEAAQFSEAFALSVVVGDDIVCRLSVPAFERFKQSLIRAIKECKAPKYRIVVGGCWYFIMGGIPPIANKEQNENENEESRSDTVLIRETREQPNYHTYVSLAEVSQKMQREFITSCPMFLPGKIMHVTAKPIFDSRPNLVEQGCGYQFRWADRSEFSEIRVAPKMMMDHYPDNVNNALYELASSLTEGPLFSVI